MARGATGLGAVLSQDSETPPRTRTGRVGVVLFTAMTAFAAVWAASLMNPEGMAFWTGIPYKSYEPTRTFPIWGYPLLGELARRLVGGDPARFLMWSQAIAGVALVLSLFAPIIRRSPWWLGGLLGCMMISLFSCIAQPWADAVFLLGYLAIAASMLVFVDPERSRQQRAVSLVVGALASGLATNVRSEGLHVALGTAVLVSVLGLVPLRDIRLRRAVRRTAVFWVAVLAGTVVCLVPWWLHTRAVSGIGQWGATNGGAVMYIGLGQLADNPWKRVALDETAMAYAAQQGWPSAWDGHASREFTRLFIEDVRRHPAAFARKLWFNFSRGLWSGLTTTPIESGRLASTPEAVARMVRMSEMLAAVYRGMLVGLSLLLVVIGLSPSMRARLTSQTLSILVMLPLFALCSGIIWGLGLWLDDRYGCAVYVMVLTAFAMAARDLWARTPVVQL